MTWRPGLIVSTTTIWMAATGLALSYQSGPTPFPSVDQSPTVEPTNPTPLLSATPTIDVGSMQTMLVDSTEILQAQLAGLPPIVIPSKTSRTTSPRKVQEPYTRGSSSVPDETWDAIAACDTLHTLHLDRFPAGVVAQRAHGAIVSLARRLQASGFRLQAGCLQGRSRSMPEA